MIALGIDPGLTGGLAVVERVEHRLRLMAVHGLANGSERPMLLQLLKQYAPEVVVVERVQASRGVSRATAFALGACYGAIMATLDLAEEWQGVVLAPSPSVWKAATRTPANKRAAMRRACEVFPGVEFVDHNQAEAALLAGYGLARVHETKE